MSRLEGNMTVLDQIVRQQEEINALRKERDDLTDYIAKHNELVQKLTIELAEYQAKEHKVGIKRCM